MTRRSAPIAAAIALLLPLATAAQADHRSHRGNGIIRLVIPPAQFGSRGMPRFRILLGNRGTYAVPYENDLYEETELWQSQPRTDHANLPPQDRARARALDRDLGRALEVLRRDLALRQPAQRPADPDSGLRPPNTGVDVTRLPSLGTTGAGPRAIIEEEAVLGPIELSGSANAEPAPNLPVGAAGVIEVTNNRPEAFAPLENPSAFGLPDRQDGARYYVLNGKIVALDPDGQRALLVATLNQVLAE